MGGEMAICKRLVLALTLVLCFTVSAQAEIATANGALKMDIPCLQYAGTSYHLILDYSPNPADPQGLYWKYNTVYQAAGQPQAAETCASIDEHLTIQIPYLYFMGYELSVTLSLYSNSADPSGIYWKLSGGQVFPVFISAVKGPGDECDPDFSQLTPAEMQALYNFQNCIIGCNGDLPCMSGCGQNLPAAFLSLASFQLSCQFNSCSPDNVPFIIPAGAYFYPQSGTFQPMLVAQDIVITVAPGLTWNCIPTYCTNLGAEVPEEDSLYTIGGIVADECMSKIIEGARGKDLSNQDKENLQDDIWDCTP